MRIELYQELPEEAKAIRLEVFVDEQGFSEEFDHIDDIATHVVAYADTDFGCQNDCIGQAVLPVPGKGIPVGTARFFTADGKQSYHLGRFAVRQPWRGTGVGAEIMQACQDGIRAAVGSAQPVVLELSAQRRARGFYTKQGYLPQGDEYLDEGYPHIRMLKILV